MGEDRQALQVISLAPLLKASFPIQLHAFAAMAAFVLGLIQFARPKGTFSHRTFGWIWVFLMLIVSISAFWIQELRVWGPWSPIHLLAVLTLVMLPIAVWRARTHKVTAHKWFMVGIFSGALVIAGIFTFVPGRIMYAVLFGG